MKPKHFRALKKHLAGQRGMSLLLLIFIMTALAGVGTAIYTFTTSSTYTELTENNRNRAYQLAWAGMNYAAEQGYAAALHNRTFTLSNFRGQFTLTRTQVGANVNVVSVGTVNSNDGMLLARAQVSRQFPAGPPQNQGVLTTGFSGGDLSAFASVRDAGNHVIIQSDDYVATGGTHLYWASFNNLGTYPVADPDNAGCNVGFYVGRLNNVYTEQLRQVWRDYNYVDYDVQVKNGWYKNLRAAASGVNIRWHEVVAGKYEGYGISYLRYTYGAAGCGFGYDYLPNIIKPAGLTNKLLLVFWEQRVEAGVERRRWLAYADLGSPSVWGSGIPRTGNDLKVVGAQDDVDGLLSDNSMLLVRVKEKFVQGQRVNEINVFYGDASPYYNGATDRLTGNVVSVDINRKRMVPEWIDASYFPSWPTNQFDSFTILGNPIFNFWRPVCSPNPPASFDFFTLSSTSANVGPNPPSLIPVLNPVRFIVNPTYLHEPATVPTDIPADLNTVTILPDKSTLRTYKFTLNNFETQSPEIGLHGMGRLNDSDRVVAFDDWAIQYLGHCEN